MNRNWSWNFLVGLVLLLVFPTISTAQPVDCFTGKALKAAHKCCRENFRGDARGACERAAVYYTLASKTKLAKTKVGRCLLIPPANTSWRDADAALPCCQELSFPVSALCVEVLGVGVEQEWIKAPTTEGQATLGQIAGSGLVQVNRKIRKVGAGLAVVQHKAQAAQQQAAKAEGKADKAQASAQAAQQQAAKAEGKADKAQRGVKANRKILTLALDSSMGNLRRLSRQGIRLSKVEQLLNARALLFVLEASFQASYDFAGSASPEEQDKWEGFVAGMAYGGLHLPLGQTGHSLLYLGFGLGGGGDGFALGLRAGLYLRAWKFLVGGGVSFVNNFGKDTFFVGAGPEVWVRTVGELYLGGAVYLGDAHNPFGDNGLALTGQVGVQYRFGFSRKRK